MDKKTVSNKNSLFATAEPTLHHVRVDPDSDEYLKVWIKEPTFLQLEKAQAKLINLNSRTNDISLEMDTLFRYLWEAFVEKTEPALTTIELHGGRGFKRKYLDALKSGKSDNPVIGSRISLYILTKELNISPAEAYQMPFSMVRDLLLIYSIQKEEEAKEMQKVKSNG